MNMNEKQKSEIFTALTVVAVMRRKVLNKVKQISNNEWCECSAKAVVGRCSSKEVSGLQLYLKENPKQVFPYEFYDIFKGTISYRTPILWWQLLAVNSVNQ